VREAIQVELVKDHALNSAPRAKYT
jgi:hypothetical protein